MLPNLIVLSVSWIWGKWKIMNVFCTNFSHSYYFLLVKIFDERSKRTSVGRKGLRILFLSILITNMFLEVHPVFSLVSWMVETFHFRLWKQLWWFILKNVHSSLLHLEVTEMTSSKFFIFSLCCLLSALAHLLVTLWRGIAAANFHLISYILRE